MTVVLVVTSGSGGRDGSGIVWCSGGAGGK